MPPIAQELTRRTQHDMGLAELVLRAATITPDRVAIRTGERVVTFGELAARTRELAKTLSGSVVADDSALVVALMMSTPTLAGAGPASLDRVLTPLRLAALSTVTTVDSRRGSTAGRAPAGR